MVITCSDWINIGFSNCTHTNRTWIEWKKFHIIKSNRKWNMHKIYLYMRWSNNWTAIRHFKRAIFLSLSFSLSMFNLLSVFLGWRWNKYYLTVSQSVIIWNNTKYDCFFEEMLLMMLNMRHSLKSSGWRLNNFLISSLSSI